MTNPVSRAELSAYNDSLIVPNGIGQITGTIVNVMNDQIIASFGAINDTNVWTGSNTFSGPVSISQSSLIAALLALPDVSLGAPIPPTGQPYWNGSGFLVKSK